MNEGIHILRLLFSNFVDQRFIIFLLAVILLLKSTFVALSQFEICRHVFLIAFCDPFSYRNSSRVFRNASGQRDVGRVFIVHIIKIR